MVMASHSNNNHNNNNNTQYRYTHHLYMRTKRQTTITSDYIRGIPKKRRKKEWHPFRRMEENRNSFIYPLIPFGLSLSFPIPIPMVVAKITIETNRTGSFHVL